MNDAPKDKGIPSPPKSFGHSACPKGVPQSDPNESAFGAMQSTSTNKQILASSNPTPATASPSQGRDKNQS